MSKRTSKEGRAADEGWETDGGTIDGAERTEAAAEATTPAEERAKRWSDAKAEHWHGGNSSDETKGRATKR